VSVKLQFVYGSAIASRAIAWFSAGAGSKRLSHVDAVLDDGSLFGARSDSVGGEPAGCYRRPANYEKWSYKVVFELTATDTQKKIWTAFLEEQYAKPYDRLAIWGFALGRAWREEDCWVCSELQARALEVAGIIPPLYLTVSRITPEALALVCSAIGGRVIEKVPAGVVFGTT